MPAPAAVYARALRDTVGSGEGVFGLTDSYPEGHPVATGERLRAIEHGVVDWRWRLRGLGRRARRTHGDFHPFNLLFDGDELAVLDSSRGGAGDPADDVTCLAINFLFFALLHRGRFDGGGRDLWDRFFATYGGDSELLAVVPPYFAWRGLVVASPVWYPTVPELVRDRLLRFVERLLRGAAFRPDRVDELLA